MRTPLETLAKRLTKSGAKVYFEATVSEEITVGKKKTKRRRNVVFGKCAKCGCTDFDCSQCIEKTGRPCSWTDATHTLCSACVEPTEELQYVLVATRGGRRHYVTGERADEGKWTKFLDRARKFTAAQVKIAKGISHAEVFRLPSAKKT